MENQSDLVAFVFFLREKNEALFFKLGMTRNLLPGNSTNVFVGEYHYEKRTGQKNIHQKKTTTGNKGKNLLCSTLLYYRSEYCTIKTSDSAISLVKMAGKTWRCIHTSQPYCTQKGQNCIQFWPF